MNILKSKKESILKRIEFDEKQQIAIESKIEELTDELNKIKETKHERREIVKKIDETINVAKIKTSEVTSFTSQILIGFKAETRLILLNPHCQSSKSKKIK